MLNENGLLDPKNRTPKLSHYFRHAELEGSKQFPRPETVRDQLQDPGVPPGVAAWLDLQRQASLLAGLAGCDTLYWRAMAGHGRES